MKAHSFSGSEIEEFFNGKSIFITGATGFVGKAVIEKILRSCPGIESIFVLIRAKRGSNAYSRLDNFINEPIFDPLRILQPHALAKIVAIEGDITLPLLGISECNLNLLRKTVSVVVHSAATVKFDEPLNVAMNINLGGTNQVLAIAESMEKIQAVVYVSTAFSNCERSFIEEKVYPVRTDPTTAISMYQTCDEEFLDALAPILVGDKPNTYILTKHLAEELINQRKMAVPVCIVRPSIVTGTYKHPMPGFVDNFNAMSGLLAGIMTGAVRTLIFNDQYKLDIVPLDYVANIIIAAACELGKTSDRSALKIYNLTSCSNPYIVTETKDRLFKEIYKNPPSRTIWYPHIRLTSNPFVFLILNLLYHRLPAYVGDFILGCAGRKRMFIPNYRKLSKNYDALKYFCTNVWKFSDENTTALYQSLSASDQINFPFNVNDIKWEDYIVEYVNGMRKYAFKDKSNAEKGKASMNRMKRKHHFVQCLIFAPLLLGTCAVIKSVLMQYFN